MPTASLEFTLFMNTADIGRGMGSVRKSVADGMRGMTQAAKEESLRIQSALASITAFRELKTGVADARAEWVKSQAEATRLGVALNQVGPPIKGLKQEFEKAKKAAADAQATFVQQSIALNALRTSMTAAGVSTTGLAAAQARLRAELAANEAKYQAQARSLQRTQDARNVLNLGPSVNTDREVLRMQAAYERLRATGNLTGVELARAHVRMTEGILALRNGTDSWAGRLMLVREQLVQLAIVGAGIGLSSREAIAFESAMSNVRKVVDFPTPGAFKELTADIKGMAREIPVPLEGLAKIAEAGGQMGIASKEIRGFTEVVAKMSTAFNISPNETGEAVGRLMNIFKLTVPETQRLGDAINHLGNNTNAVERDILNVMNRTGGMAKVFGLANTESAALGTAFLALGRPPEIAATAINALMLTLQTAPTREADFKQALARMGISAEKLAADIGKNPQQTLLTFLETLKSLDKQTQSETLATIFGRQYADDISILLAGLDTYKNALDLVSRETNYAGSMQKEFNERVKTTASQMQLASNAISEAGVNLGTVFLPAIVTASQTIAAMAHGAADLTDRFPKLAAGAVTALTALAGFAALRLAWSVMRAGVVALAADIGLLAVAATRLIFTPVGAVLTAASVAAYAFSRATASSVPPLLESLSAMSKSREATAEKIKTLEELKGVMASTKEDTKEHTEAEEKLASLLPEANLSLDAQGRIMAKVGDAAEGNAAKLDKFIGQLKAKDAFDLASQMETQSQAIRATRKELDAYLESMKKRYGATGETQTPSQKNWQQMDRLNGTLEKNKVAGSELRRTHDEVAAAINKTMREAKLAGMSVEDLGRAMDGIHADSATKEQVLTLFRGMSEAAASTSGKVNTLSDAFKQFSIAISGPAAAAKKGFVDAIGAADLQLGKHHEALVLHRGKLKEAVDDETKSYKSLADAATSSFDTVTQAMDEQFAHRRDRLQAMAGDESRRSQFLAAGAERDAQRQSFSQRAMLQATNAFVIEETEAKLREADRYLTQAMALSRKEFQTKIDNAKRLGIDAARVDEERLQSQRGVLEKTASAYRQNIDKMIAEEKRLRDEARQLAEQRKDFNASVADRVANVKEKGMDPAQVYMSRQKRIAQEQTQAEAALQAGNFEMARKHADKMIALAESTSDAVSRGDKVVVDSKTAAARAIKQIQDAAQIENQAFTEEEKAKAGAADALQKSAEASTDKLGRLRDTLKEVDAALVKDHTLIITANLDKIREAGKEIDDLLEKKDRVVKIKAELQGGATALESVTKDVLAGETDKAQTSLDVVSRVFERFKTEFATWQPEVKASFDTVSATGSIDGLMAKFKEFKATVPDAPRVTFDAEVGTAMSAIDNLITRIAEIPSGKTVTVNYVEQRSASPDQGTVPGLARGGFLPGWGTADDIPALLQRGEFVFRKEAVRLYGLDRLHAMNQMRLPRFAHGGLVQHFKMPTIPRFEFGGVVRNLVIPTIPQVAFAGGGAVTPQVTEVMRLDLSTDGRPSASITAPPADIRGIVNALREYERRMR
ncbi:MAG: phage tail tape measure protein [Magnetococcales bacterium]|nr:phage tail tape measure protein [Magnetococcales bacterium]